jgi:glycosyltransferase involved in cell wall biosynthesis
VTGIVHLVGPVGVADPARPSGGNVYDVHLARALEAGGRDVVVHESTSDDLGRALDGLPDGATVVVDGIVGSAAPQALTVVRGRLKVVVVVHLPIGLSVAGSPARPEPEARALAAVDAVVCTSRWTRDWVHRAYDIPDGVLHVVRPGVEAAALAEPSTSGCRLLSVGAITPVKGHDVLVEALTRLGDRSWTWTLVGASVDAGHATGLWSKLYQVGLDARVTLAGALTGPALAAAYAGADLVVLPSRHETYGMVATEALARGVPVVASDVGGVREAIGTAAGGDVPGVLVPPDDVDALTDALRRWLDSAELRARLRSLAAERRGTLAGWDRTAAGMLDVVAGLGEAGRLG